jgi:hypothetical protein
MDDSTLPQVVAALEALPQRHQPYVGITDEYDGDAYLIEANPEGLIALAKALLKGAQQTPGTPDSPAAYSLEVEGAVALDASPLFLPDYIRLTEQAPANNPQVASTDFRSFLTEVGCFLLGGLLILSLVVGLVTIVKWIF